MEAAAAPVVCEYSGKPEPGLSLPQAINGGTFNLQCIVLQLKEGHIHNGVEDMPIGSDRPTAPEAEKRRWSLLKIAAVALLGFLVGVPLLLYGIIYIHRQFETPQERAAEDAYRAQAEKIFKENEAATDLLAKQTIWARTQRDVVKINVLARLKDPESAYFGRVFVLVPEKFDEKADGNVCGYVNAKNSFGGYTGMKGFVSSGNKLYIEPNEDFYANWNRYCVKGEYL